MNANYHGNKKLRTYAEKLNVLRSAKETELLALGIKLGFWTMAVVVNRNHKVANKRLIYDIASAYALWATEFNADAELAAERLMQVLETKMGADWESEVEKACVELCKVLTNQRESEV